MVEALGLNGPAEGHDPAALTVSKTAGLGPRSQDSVELAQARLLRSVRGLVDCELASVLRRQLVDETLTRETPQIEVALGCPDSLRVPVNVHAVDRDGRIIDIELVSVL